MYYYSLRFCILVGVLNEISYSLAQPTTTDLWKNEELLSVPKSTTSSSADVTISESINRTNAATEIKTSIQPGSSADTSANENAISSGKVYGNATLVDKLSHQVRIILKHFQGPEPVGIPGQTILTEPLYAPDTNASLVVATGTFYNITIWGLSNFTINVVNTKLDDMEAYVELMIRKVIVEGNYSVHNLLVNSEGPFNITMLNVTAIATIDLATDDDGRLYANNSVLDMVYKNIETDMSVITGPINPGEGRQIVTKNIMKVTVKKKLKVELSDVNSLLKPFVSSGGAAVLSAEKEHILANVNERLLVEIDRRLAPFPKIPLLHSLSPVDLAILEAKKFVKSRYEPYIISNVIDFENPFIKVHAGPVTVNGISKFARVGNVTLGMANETVTIGIRIVTGRLNGNCKWFYDFGQVGIKRFGESNFTVERVQFEATVDQNVDSRRPPVLRELEIETGPIRLRMDGHGHFDYLVEMVVKILPKMLRYAITDALEEPLKRKIQADILAKISVDRVVEENISDIKKYLSDKL